MDSIAEAVGGMQFPVYYAREILRDKLVFGMRDNKVQERLLREPRLTLAKTDEICRAAENLDTHMKTTTLTYGASTLVNAVKSQDYQKDNQSSQGNQAVPDKQRIPLNKSDTSECWYCGCKHELRKRELCPAFGKLCNKCHKPNHCATTFQSEAQ